MANQPKTAQGWAWDYIKHRLKTIAELSGLSENLPKITTFADLKEGELFIRFPWFVIDNGKLETKNTELYRKIQPVQQVHGMGGHYNAMKVLMGSIHEIPDDEPAVVIR